MFGIRWLHGKNLERLLLVGLLIVSLALILIPQRIYAQESTPGACDEWPNFLTEEYSRTFKSWFDPSCAPVVDTCNNSAPVTQAPDSAAEFDIPPIYQEIFQRAGEEHDVDWLLISTVHKIEQGGAAFQLPIPAVWPESPTGAEGPFQFIDSTWNSYKTDANNDGIEDINNLEDAAFAAASLLKALGASSDIPLGALDDVEFQLPDADTDHRSVQHTPMLRSP